jgi:hypothetical protein
MARNTCEAVDGDRYCTLDAGHDRGAMATLHEQDGSPWETPDIPGGWLDSFTQGYALAQLWASTSEIHDTEGIAGGPDPYAWQDDRDPVWALSAFTPASQAMIRSDVSDFTAANWADLRDLDPGSAGHDFSLSRNGHGAGYFDRGYGELGDRLQDAARVYGSSTASYDADADGSCVSLDDEPAADAEPQLPGPGRTELELPRIDNPVTTDEPVVREPAQYDAAGPGGRLDYWAHISGEAGRYGSDREAGH